MKNVNEVKREIPAQAGTVTVDTPEFRAAYQDFTKGCYPRLVAIVNAWQFNITEHAVRKAEKDGYCAGYSEGKRELSAGVARAVADGRRLGRAEALTILMQLDAETGIDDYTGWSSSGAPEDEGCAHWKEEKLRELFSVDGALADMMDKAEEQYWHYKGLQGEAERAHNFAVNMYSSGRVREVLAKAGEHDLIGQLCSAAQVPAPVAASQPNPQAATYPREIWLQAGDCSPDEALPYTDGLELTWCWENIDSLDVRYVRADLAHTQQPAAVPAEQVQESDYTVQHSELARKIITFFGRATTGSLEPGADRFADRLAEKLFQWIGDIPSASKPTQPPAGELPVMPEPDCFLSDAEDAEGYPVFNRNKMRAFYQQGHAAGLEEAEKVVSPHHERQAACWRAFERACRTQHIAGAGHGRRFKIIEISQQTGDETEFDGFETAIRDEAIRALNRTGAA